MTPFTAEDVDLPDFLAILRRWVDMETPTNEPARVNALVSVVEAHAVAAGLVQHRSAGKDGFGDLLAVRTPTWQPDSRGILVLAHLDTVHPVGSFSWREDGERIYGPGIYDMKAGALMAMRALELLVRRMGDACPPVTILFNSDEEMGSPSSREWIEAEARRAEAVLVVEPARNGGKIVVARKGVAMFDVKVTGRASHAGTNPTDGHSAIRAAAEIVLALEACNNAARGVTVTVGSITGGTARNVIPDHCRMVVDARIPDDEAAADLMQRIEDIKVSDPEVTFVIHGGINRPPYVQTLEARRLFAFARDRAAPLGIDLIGSATGGGSDGNFTAAMGIPTLDGLGADGANAHSHREHILVKSIPPRLALLANLFMWDKNALAEIDI
jgi:glutamate carboxypeptidase